MSKLRIAEDATGEPTIWDGDKALVCRNEVDQTIWNLLEKAVEFDSTLQIITLFLTVVGGRIDVPDNVVEALSSDAEVVRWRDHAHNQDVWEVFIPEQRKTG
jgi:hypothetical protein